MKLPKLHDSCEKRDFTFIQKAIGGRTCGQTTQNTKSSTKRKKYITKKTLQKQPARPQNYENWQNKEKNKNDLPPEIPKIPQLRKPQTNRLNIVANTFDEKIVMLKNSFFPPLPKTNLPNLDDYTYSPAAYYFVIITKEKVLRALLRPKSDKTSGPNGITNKILKTCADKLKIPLIFVF